MHVMAGKAVCFALAARPDFREYAASVVANAKALGAALQARGFRLVSGGTDNHLLLVDLRPKGLTGKRAEQLLDAVGITCNKNMIPFDPEKPLVTSGIRLGTAALTTRGFDAAAMEDVAEAMDRVLSRPEDEAEAASVRDRVRSLSDRFPLYPSMVEPWPESR